jgi:hypothetical protein
MDRVLARQKSDAGGRAVGPCVGVDSSDSAQAEAEAAAASGPVAAPTVLPASARVCMCVFVCGGGCVCL